MMMESSHSCGWHTRGMAGTENCACTCVHTCVITPVCAHGLWACAWSSSNPEAYLEPFRSPCPVGLQVCERAVAQHHGSAQVPEHGLGVSPLCSTPWPGPNRATECCSCPENWETVPQELSPWLGVSARASAPWPPEVLWPFSCPQPLADP